MPVTELARLRLLPGTEITSEALSANLLKAKKVMEDASGFEFFYYHCVEDPSVIFIVGAWPSVEFHMEEFIPKAPNQELLVLVKDQIEVEWMFHVDINQAEKPIPRDTKMICIGRHYVKENGRPGFQKTFDENKYVLEPYIGGMERVVGGWRLDKGFDPSSERGDKDEWVLFSGWESIEYHYGFGDKYPEEFKNYMQIRDHLDGAEIRHGTLFDPESRIVKDGD